MRLPTIFIRIKTNEALNNKENSMKWPKLESGLPADCGTSSTTSIPKNANTLAFFCPFFMKKWPELESNQRHKDFQSSALPSELSGHRMDQKVKMIERGKNFINRFRFEATALRQDEPFDRC
jgi:hypothetical protein